MRTVRHWKTTKTRQKLQGTDRSRQAARVLERYHEAPSYQPVDAKDAARQAGYLRGVLAVRDGSRPQELREMWDEYRACGGGAPFNSEELTVQGLEMLVAMHVIYDQKPLPTIDETIGKFSSR